MIYGRAGIGKTSFMAEFPDAILFSCERVSKGIECFDFNAENGGITSWEVFRQGVKLLKKSKQFQAVCIDTIDAAYNLCVDYICRKNGVASIGDIDYGKGWNALKQEFAEQIDAIWKTGRGVIFSSHAKEVRVDSASGIDYTRIMPSAGKQVLAYIKAKTDFVFYAEYVRIKNKTIRVLFTQGDEMVEAKHADVAGFPEFLPMLKGKGLQTVLDAFAGKDVGLDPALIRPSDQTSEAATDSITKSKLNRTKEILKGKGAKKKKKKSRSV